VEGWFFASAALLVVSGAGKLVDTRPTTGALRAAGLPNGGFVVRGLGLSEIAIGLGNLLWASTLLAWGQAALYGAFALFVVWALSRNIAIASCGCFGKPDTPPTWLHVFINTTAAAGAIYQAVIGPKNLGAVLADQALAGVPYLGFLGLGAYCLYLLLGELPLLRTST
jgi:hypothetical protein